jgi:O-antigen ligase/polysaccharide polymerase Wzy-like membrane protein
MPGRPRTGDRLDTEALADLAFRLYLASLPFTATAVINPGAYGVPLSYLTFALFTIVFLQDQRPLIQRDMRPVLALGLFVTGLIGSSILSISGQRVSEAIRDAAYFKLATQAVYWLAAVAQFWLSYVYLSALDDRRLVETLRFAALVAVVIASYSLYQFLALAYDLPLADFLRNSASYVIARGSDVSGWAGLPRARGFAPEPSFWSSYVLVALGWALAVFRGRARVLSLGVLLLSLILSFARTGWFGLLALSAVFALLHGSRRERLLIAMTGLSLIGTLLFFELLGSDVLGRMVSFEDLSAVERFTTQVDAFYLALSHPWFGLGWGFYDVFFGGVEHTAVTFNLYISIFVGGGMLGLALLGIYIGSVARSGSRLDVEGVWRLGIQFSFGAVLFSWLTIPGFNFSYMWVAMAFAALSTRSATVDGSDVAVKRVQGVS